MQSGSSTCYSAFISVSQPQSLSLPCPALSPLSSCSHNGKLVLVAIVYMCPTSAQCVGGSKLSSRQILHRRPVECVTCFNQRLGRHIRARALHLGHRLIKLSLFDFLRAPSMSRLSQKSPPGSVPPSPSLTPHVVFCSPVGLPLPSGHTVYLPRPQSTPMP